MNLKILTKLWQWWLCTNDRDFPKTISAVQTCIQISFHETRKTSSAARPSVPFFLLPQKLVECRSFNYSNEVQFVWSWYDGYIIGPSERFFHFESGMPQEKVGGGLWQGLWQKYAPEITELHFSFHRVCGPSSLSPLSLSRGKSELQFCTPSTPRWLDFRYLFGITKVIKLVVQLSGEFWEFWARIRS